ncbi:putative zinc finger protein [Temnothorax longispinosus]|uniref:Putative zinc finger protein n=1 Tax=Temnothorax longispinosus TaxID=300112 RepID=A0A4S2KRF3_9HYME|nr:putative zinc finger protein [Temnothorax longispinosus]
MMWKFQSLPIGMRCILKMSLSIACRLDVNVLSALVVWENYEALGTNTTNRSSNYADRKFRFKHVDHTGRYKCSKCAKSYRWKHHLVEHVKASCGQKKAECCPYCSYKSNRKWNLKSHIKRIHASV